MESLISLNNIHSQLCLLLFFLSLSPPLLSSAYTPPDKFFINCGSDSTTSFGHDRLFIGDLKPTSLQIRPGKSISIRSNNVSKGIPELYHTARVYHSPAWYEFAVDRNGTYVLRLHFFPLSLPTIPDLAKARFTVSAPGYTLLSNFTAQNQTNKPLINEFVLTLQQGRFGLFFSPSPGSSLAFVNAIELFLGPDTPAGFIPDRAAGESHTENQLLSKALKPIYRINMGGLPGTPENDTIWRNWVPDDSYLAIPEAAKNSETYTESIKYGVNLTKYIAPDFVYNTAKVLNINGTGNQNFSKITWGFQVSKNTKHFIRVHFCDIIHNSVGFDRFHFNFFIDSKFNLTVDPLDVTLGFAVPFYYDVVVVSDDSGFLNISVGLNSSSLIQDVLLNGLEIMKLIEKSESGPVLKDEPKRNKREGLKGCLIGGVVFLVISGVMILLYFRNRTAAKAFGKRFYGGWISYDRPSDGATITSLAPHMNLQWKKSFKEILIATDNFDEKHFLGEGGFGKVYKGTMDNTRVAVKRSEDGNGQGVLEFQTEVLILSEIRHRHLVRLIGYCDENSEMILVYEFMEKGTLREHLYGSNEDSQVFTKCSELSWKQRLQICIDAAKGLDYLHTGPSGEIIHRDVKTTNILLDENMVAKVADFGLSKAVVPDSDESATGIKGTFGYLDPEYFFTAQLTQKSDVYSFGVVLLEVLSARSPILVSAPREEVNLAEWGMVCLGRGELDKITDPFLLGTINSASLKKFVETAEKCLMKCSNERPTMHEVVWELQYALQFHEMPMHDDDTTMNGELEIGQHVIQRLPSKSLSLMEDDINTRGIVSLDDTNASSVFSQLNVSRPR